MGSKRWEIHRNFWKLAIYCNFVWQELLASIRIRKAVQKHDSNLSIFPTCTHWWVRQLEGPDWLMVLGHSRVGRLCQVWLCYNHWMVSRWHQYLDIRTLWACQSWQPYQFVLRLWEKVASKRTWLWVTAFSILPTISTWIFLQTINWDNAKGSLRRSGKETETRVRLRRRRWRLRTSNA